MTLCSTCTKFDLRTVLLSTGENWPTTLKYDRNYYVHKQAQVLCYRHSESISQILRSASDGCHLCGLIHAAFACKEPETREIASSLPVVFARSAKVMDATEDPPFQETRLEPQIKVFLVSPTEGLIGLCKFDISTSDGIGSIQLLDFHPAIILTDGF